MGNVENQREDLLYGNIVLSYEIYIKYFDLLGIVLTGFFKYTVYLCMAILCIFYILHLNLQCKNYNDITM